MFDFIVANSYIKVRYEGTFYLENSYEELKKKIYQNESSFNCSHVANPSYEDSSQKNMEKIKFLQNEIKKLKKEYTIS